MKYRVDIDGLRTLAVIPVVLFHAGFSFFSGGYIGVDIFFVISGYLITSILLNEIEKNDSISLTQFYVRRARRILPALCSLILIVLIIGYFILFPDDYLALAKSAIASILFIPNIHFWQSTGYFAVEASSTPLLHTWSLGIEEQYYIFFPLIIAIAYRYFNKRVLFGIVLTLCIISFVLSLYYIKRDGAYTFYMLPTRAWELLIGSLLAFRVIRYDIPRFYREFLAALGGISIVLAIVFFDEKTLFPGVSALLPVFGAALIIYSGELSPTIVSRVLSQKSIVFIGLISYSLYLWHWPITVYINTYIEHDLNKYIIVASSFLAAIFSFYIIEQPFRHKKIMTTDKQVLCFSVSAMSIVLLLSFIIFSQKGIKHRFSEDLIALSQASNYMHINRECHFKTLSEIQSNEYCTFGKKDEKPIVALIGDSHADALIPAINQAVLNLGVSGIQLTNPGCRPLLNVYRPGTKKCMDFIDKSFQIVLSNPDIEHVFLHGYWGVLYEGFGYRNHNFEILYKDLTEKSNKTVFEKGIRSTLEALLKANKKVYIVGGVPEIGFNLPKKYATSLYLNKDFNHKFDLKINNANNFLKELTDKYNLDSLTYIDLESAICPKGTCFLIEGGLPIYRDGDHITAAKAKALSKLFINAYMK